SAEIALMTQLWLPVAGTGSGGPKKQRASGTQNGPSDGTRVAQSLSRVQATEGALAQCFVASGPWGPDAGAPAGCAAGLATLPFQPLTSKMLVGPSGFGLGPVRVLPPPPR